MCFVESVLSSSFVYTSHVHHQHQQVNVKYESDNLFGREWCCWVARELKVEQSIKSNCFSVLASSSKSENEKAFVSHPTQRPCLPGSGECPIVFSLWLVFIQNSSLGFSLVGLVAKASSCQVQNYMVRTSLSLIILAMVQNPTKKKGIEGGVGSRCYQVPGFDCWHCRLSFAHCKVADIGNVTDSGGGGSEEEGELDWDNVQVGFVFSSFSWGYMTTQVLCSMLCEAFSSQIIGGRLAELYGFKKVKRF